MRHRIKRELLLDEGEIKKAICYWLKEFCDKPTPGDMDAICFVEDAPDGNVNNLRALIEWLEEVPE